MAINIVVAVIDSALKSNRINPLVVVGSLVVVAVGCSRGPSAIGLPTLSPLEVGRAAVAEFDESGDEALSKAELKRCPVLLEKFAELDASNNSLISADEIARRIEGWQTTGVGLVGGYTCFVLRDGRPLAGAQVRLVPESFLGPSIKPASGQTDPSGVAYLAIDKDDLPEELKNLRGVHFGIYRVEITHPSEQIAPRYNTETTLGCEVYPSGTPEPYTFRLTTRSDRRESTVAKGTSK